MDYERLGEIVFGVAAIGFGVLVVVAALTAAVTAWLMLVVHATIAAGFLYYDRVIRLRQRARDRGERRD